jgi:5-methylthioadenosine/S-adenosylhomocysteine deaminase
VSEILLISARHLVPVRPENQVLDNHTVVVQGSKILEILPRQEATQRYPEAVEKILDGHVLIPGLINMHSHAPMSLLRGYADDLDMQSWLQHHIWPVENTLVSERFVADGTRLAIAEMLRGGTTCFNDLYFFPEVAIAIVQETGIRASLGFPVLDMPTPWSKSAADCLDKATRQLQAARNNNRQDGRISFALAPHAPYSVNDDAFRQIAHLSAEWHIPVHLHLLETAYDISHSLAAYFERPLQRLDRLGVLNERLLAVHMTQLEKTDIPLLKERGVNVIHCPRSNLKLSSGYCPIADLLQAGVNVSVGTDGAASNNRLDILSETQIAGLLAKGQTGNAACVDAFTQLEMMTINAATALGQSEVLGSIQPGKWADMVALDLSQPETQPLHNVISQIAYAASSRQITDVWVAGRHLLQNGVLEHTDMTELLDNAAHWRKRISVSASGRLE